MSLALISVKNKSFSIVFYQSAERFAGNMEVRPDDYKSWGVTND